jgi:hypothetical protein
MRGTYEDVRNHFLGRLEARKRRMQPGMVPDTFLRLVIAVDHQHRKPDYWVDRDET